MWGMLGIVLSAGWLTVAYLWFDREIGLDNLSYVLLPEVVGQYVAGLLAPLILIWVLMGYLRGPRAVDRLREEVATLRDELTERARQEAARPRPEAPPRRPAEPALAVPANAPPAPAPVALAPTPKPAQPLAVPRPVPAPAVTPAVGPALAPLGPVPPVAPLVLADPAPPMAATEPATVTSLAQEVARNLGRLANDPPVGAPALEGEAAQDEEFRQLTHKVGRDLNAICMDLSAVLCRKSARDEALKAYNRGHKEAFHVLVRDYLSRHDPSEIMARLTQADAQTLLHTYAMKFASLIDEAGRRDASGVQEQGLRGSAMGQLYEEVQRHTQLARAASRP